MAMSDLKQKLLLYELARVGFPDAIYIPESDKIKVQSDNDRLPFINDAGDISYGTEYIYLATSTIRPLVEKVNESVAVWEQSNYLPIKKVEQFKSLAEYNNVVLAVRDDTGYGRGLHFVTWRYNQDRTDVESGVYADDYNTAKESFASRSELVSREKLFTKEQAVEILAAIEYRIEYDRDMTIATKSELKTISDNLYSAYKNTEPTKPTAIEQTTDKPKPKTLAGKMQAASKKVKAQDETPAPTKPHKRDARD